MNMIGGSATGERDWIGDYCSKFHMYIFQIIMSDVNIDSEDFYDFVSDTESNVIDDGVVIVAQDKNEHWGGTDISIQIHYNLSKDYSDT